MLIPQIERFASKYKYAKWNINVLNKVLNTMSEKAVNQTGNHYVFVVNAILFTQINTALGDWLKVWNSVPTMLYSKAENNFVKADNPMKVGGTFVSYEVAGNTVSFMVDRALSKEMDRKGYGLCLDMTPDATTAKPAVKYYSGCAA